MNHPELGTGAQDRSPLVIESCNASRGRWRWNFIEERHIIRLFGVVTRRQNFVYTSSLYCCQAESVQATSNQVDLSDTSERTLFQKQFGKDQRKPRISMVKKYSLEGLLVSVQEGLDPRPLGYQRLVFV